MKYYCEGCQTTIETLFLFRENYPVCPYCCDHPKLIKLPDYETVEQWEKRTEKKYPEDGPVWFKNKNPLSDFVWGVCMYVTAKKDKDICICITSPVPPPNDWELEK